MKNFAMNIRMRNKNYSDRTDEFNWSKLIQLSLDFAFFGG